jgi:glutaredoxin
MTLSVETAMKKNTLNLLATGLLLGLSVCAAQGQPLYRIVGPDGRVTFSDIAPLQGTAKAAGAEGGGAAASGGGPALPYELQQIASRYPVMLFTGEGCGPCASGRTLLIARGIPFAERTVNTQADIAALQRLTGDASLPFLTIGTQQIKGFSDAEWMQFLDAAEYPRKSQMPAGYQVPAATPLVAAQRPVPSGAGSQGAASDEPGVETVNTRPRPVPSPSRAADPNPSGIRF